MGKYICIPILVAVIALLQACGVNMKTADKFDWKATESGPKDYPMQVVSGLFHYRGEPEGTGLYVPSGKTIYYGWGQMVSSHIVGPDLKPLPDRLDITFFSYLEDQHYQGTFELPYERILAMFRDGGGDKGYPTYDRIMVGIAPGGTVAVWLTGQAKTTEVLFDKADPVEMTLTGMRGVVIRDREDYVRQEVEDTLSVEFLQQIQRNGIPFKKWSELRKRYNWEPIIPYGNVPKDTVDIHYFNGEFERLPLVTENLERTDFAVPRQMQFSYRSPEGWAYLYIIHFDEEETTQAFERLGSEQRALQLEFHPAKPISDTQIILSNGEESILLEKYFIEDI